VHPQSTACLEAYLSACQRLDVDAIIESFAANAVIIDPLGRYEGRQAVLAYFQGLYAGLSALHFKLGRLYWCASTCAFAWQARARRSGGAESNYEGIDAISFTADGYIAELRAFWSPAGLIGSDHVETGRASRCPEPRARP
jgi:hypothetical protein